MQDGESIGPSQRDVAFLNLRQLQLDLDASSEDAAELVHPCDSSQSIQTG